MCRAERVLFTEILADLFQGHLDVISSPFVLIDDVEVPTERNKSTARLAVIRHNHHMAVRKAWDQRLDRSESSALGMMWRYGDGALIREHLAGRGGPSREHQGSLWAKFVVSCRAG